MINVIPARRIAIFILPPGNRFLRNSGIVDIPAAKYTGTNNHPSKSKIIIAFHSNAPTAMPAAAPVPANPIKCELPIFDEKSENATGKNHRDRPASKKSVASTSDFFLRPLYCVLL